MFPCVCRDGLWRTSQTSFGGLMMTSTTLLLLHLWVNGDLSGAFLILDTTEMPLIPWTILMSPGGRTRDDDTSPHFRTYAGTPDGSWPAETGGFVTCQSGFLGSTGMSRLFPGLLQTLGVLRRMTWPRPSQSLLYMSSAISWGVIRFRITSRGLIYMRWFVRVSHPILNPLRPFLTTQLMPLLVVSLLTRRLLLSNSGADILSTHTRSSATSGPEWTVQWDILLCFIIQRRLCAWCRAYSLSGACWRRCRLHGGGVGVHGMDQYDLCSFFFWHFIEFGCNPIALALFGVFMTLFVILFRCFITLFFVI